MYFDIAKEKFNSLKNKKDLLILGIETSCDDTSVSLVKNGKEVLKCEISSQLEIHKRFGGVVPEVASRNHAMAINNLFLSVTHDCGVSPNDIDAIAVTYGAGLMGALMVGVTYAKSLAYALEKPLIKVNHIKAHIAANYIEHSDLKPPFMALVVSGGHTAILRIDDYVNSTLIGTTHDDAVGEAYDKVAKVLGLEYPGGPVVDRLAKLGKDDIVFTKPHGSNLGEFNFSYSGLKTAVINYIHKIEQNGEKVNVADVCASFQKQAVGELVKKSIKACKKYNMKTLVIAGGVSANSYLRSELTKVGEENGVRVLLPSFEYCTDNASMIGAEAYNLIRNGEGLADLSLNADPSINLKYTKSTLSEN